MNLSEYAKIRELMFYYQEIGDDENFKKYYDKLCAAYKEITGKNFEEEIDKLTNNAGER